MNVYTRLASRKTLRKKGWLEMTEYSFVLDINDKKLAPCNINKAWYLIRKNKAMLVQKIPMVIKLKKEIKEIQNEVNQEVQNVKIEIDTKKETTTKTK